MLIAQVISFSVRHRTWVLVVAVVVLLFGAWYASGLKLDALPDLSETQVIVKAEFAGQPPQLVEDQVTYPLTAALSGVPGATTVRAVSMFGEAFVYVVFADGVDPYWARSRVLERTSQLGSTLPAGATVALGPDASGTGWIYQYALVSKSGRTPIDRLRALQDFVLKRELQGVPGVAEVASFGGAVKTLQVEVDPERLLAGGVGVEQVTAAVRSANQARGGSALEMGRQRYFVSSDARIQSAQELLDVPVADDGNGNVRRLRQFGRVSFGPAPREGVADLNGRGDVAGGIIVMRQGENAAETLSLVERKLASLRASLPADVEVLTTYDRSKVIKAAIRSLAERLGEEGAVVALVCAVFLLRLRSAFVAIVALPIGLVLALSILRAQGATANIMSLGGLAIAVGAMIDAAVVMVENLHRKLERAGGAEDAASRWSLVKASAVEVGPALFFSLLIITVSFLPVLSLTGMEGKLFAPLALTKTYAMGAATLTSVTLIPVLMGIFIRGRVRREHRNPLARVSKRAYRPMLKATLKRPWIAVAVAVVVGASAIYPALHMGSEFMPSLDEGDLLYMPTTLPSVSVDEAAEILRVTNRAIREMPQVALVHGKAGRSDSATDPAPISMLETTIVLKPRSQWPEPISTEELIRQLEHRVHLAGLSNSWGFPIRTRIDMLSTGVKTPLALRVSGPRLADIDQLVSRAEGVLRGVKGVRGAFAERTASGLYVDVRVDRAKAALFGVKASDVTQLVEGPIGGAVIDYMAVGRERYPITLRYPRAHRQSIAELENTKIRASNGNTVLLSQVATVSIQDGATEVKSENSRPVGYVLLDLADGDTGGVIERARTALTAAGIRQDGYTLEWVGQYLRLEEASSRLWFISAGTLLLVTALLYLHFRSAIHVGMVLVSLPFAAAGGLWLNYLLGYRMSFATVVGLLALAGVAAEFCVVMLLYLDQAMQEQPADEPGRYAASVRCAVVRGALLRLRPKLMTVAVILGGLIPLMVSEGVGVDVMRRIAAPMVGGMLTAPAFSLLVIPALYVWVFGRKTSCEARQELATA